MEYDEAPALLSYLVKLGEGDRLLFRTSITSLLDPYDLSRLSVGPKWIYIGSDSNGFEAGGGGGVMSGIEFDQGEWTSSLAEDYGAALRAHCGAADDQLIIAVAELLQNDAQQSVCNPAGAPSAIHLFGHYFLGDAPSLLV